MDLRETLAARIVIVAPFNGAQVRNRRQRIATEWSIRTASETQQFEQ
jgi:hypothetical protein